LSEQLADRAFRVPGWSVQALGSRAAAVGPALAAAAIAALALVGKAGLDQPHEGEAEDRGDADGDPGALAHRGADIVVKLVDLLAAQAVGEAGDSVRRLAGIFAVIVAEPLVDRVGGVGDDPRKLLEDVGGAGLAGVGELADLASGLVAQVVDLAAQIGGSAASVPPPPPPCSPPP
jgi:hypothetical protein